MLVVLLVLAFRSVVNELKFRGASVLYGQTFDIEVGLYKFR